MEARKRGKRTLKPAKANTPEKKQRKSLPPSTEWNIGLTPTAQANFNDVKDQRVKRAIADSIDGLKREPDKQGKPLVSELQGYRSLRAVGQRYRIIYTIRDDRVLVLVVMIGLRKEGDKNDPYALAKKLIKLGLLD